MRSLHPVEKLFDTFNEAGASAAPAKPAPLDVADAVARHAPTSAAAPPHVMAQPPVAAPGLPETFYERHSTNVDTAEPKRKNRVVGYARRSSAKEYNDSIDRQERLINDVAMAQCGRVVDEMYVDEHFSGRTWERPALKRLLEDAKNGEFDVVIIEDIDRLARDVRITSQIKYLFKLYGVTLMSWHARGPVNNADIAFRSWYSAEQLEALAKNVAHGTRTAIEKGLGVAQMPIGYKKVPGNRGVWIVDEELRPLIVQAFQDRLDGLLLHEIATKLASHPLTATRSWNVVRVRRFLTNPKYRGLHVWGRTNRRLNPELGYSVSEQTGPSDWVHVDPRHTAHWQIVTPEMWNAVYKTVSKHYSRPTKRPLSALNGVEVTCGHCDTAMKWRYHNYDDQWHVFCPKRCIAFAPFARDVEACVLKAARKVLADPELEGIYREAFEKQRLVITAEVEAKRTALAKRLIELTALLDRLFDQVVVQGFPAEQVAEQRSKATEEREVIKRALAALPVAPPAIEDDARNTLVKAYDMIVERRHRPDLADDPAQVELYIHAYAAVRRMIGTVRIKSVFASRAFEVETTLKVNAIFHRTSYGESPVAQRVFSDLIEGVIPYFKGVIPGRLKEAVATGLYDATDEQFEAVLPFMPESVLKQLKRYGSNPRLAVNQLFIMGRTNMPYGYLDPGRCREYPRRGRGMAIKACLKGGVWVRICEVLDKQFPELAWKMHRDIRAFYDYNRKE
ncbi:hypothetical protein DK26_01125 [Bosea sp. WAO]|uniref:recombinase family protein n=1 Tax=Bosea sp. WAO TaxID=406341 RepID=UPI0007498987|nr:recombinase family protein [Bosea sp. WAO]KUL97306.1 hypothetical protein DK26_01125 [Bosea sp. WAO]